MNDLENFLSKNALNVLSEYNVKRFNFERFTKIDCDVYLPFYKKNLQRELVWAKKDKEELIKSIMIDLAIPPIIIAQRLSVENDFIDKTNLDLQNKICYIIDGKQRLNTVKDYLDNQFPVLGYYYKDLSMTKRINGVLDGRDLQWRILTGLNCISYEIPVLSHSLFDKELTTFLFPKNLQDDMITLFLKNNHTGVSQDKKSLQEWSDIQQKFSH